MTYPELLQHFYSLRRFGVKPGLERISALLSRLGNPHRRYASIHVVGTNGKGSTAAFLASILSSAGYRTALFTSPHLTSFTERMRIDGIEVDEEALVAAAERALSAAPPGTTFFELVTATASLWFAEQQAEVAVVEAGMGGASDATAAFPGMATVITPVALDHCMYLGDSIAAIAREKSGIVKSGVPVILSAEHPEAVSAVQDRCGFTRSPLYRIGTDFDASWIDRHLEYRGLDFRLPGLRPGIGGRYQRVNAAAALAAAEVLGRRGLSISIEALRAGIEVARWPGRMELAATEPAILLDGAHNPEGARALWESLGDYSFDRLIVVVGVMEDKEVDGILAPILPAASAVLAVAPALERAMAPERLTQRCSSFCTRCVDAGDVASGVARARTLAADRDLILVYGSLFTVGEARAFLSKTSFHPFSG